MIDPSEMSGGDVALFMLVGWVIIGWICLFAYRPGAAFAFLLGAAFMFHRKTRPPKENDGGR